MAVPYIGDGTVSKNKLTNEDYRLVVEFWRAVADDVPRGRHEAEWRGEGRRQKVSDALDNLLNHMARIRDEAARPEDSQTYPDATSAWREEFAEMLAERGVLVS